jgi:hypothetical protein
VERVDSPQNEGQGGGIDRENTQVGTYIGVQRTGRILCFHPVGIPAAAFLSIVAMASGSLAAPDLKIAVKTTFPGQPAETSDKVADIHDDWRRIEEHGKSPMSLWPRRPAVSLSTPVIVGITRCDLGQTFWLNLDGREYMTMPVSKFPSKEALRAPAALQRPPASQFIVLMGITTTDTGERKQRFGYAAGHVITSRKQIPLAESEREPQENLTDGWYVDLDVTVSCDRTPPRRSHVRDGKRGEKWRSATLSCFYFQERRNPGERPRTSDETIISLHDLIAWPARREQGIGL